MPDHHVVERKLGVCLGLSPPKDVMDCDVLGVFAEEVNEGWM